MAPFCKSRHSRDSDAMTAIYAAVAASILMWSGPAARPADSQVTTNAPADAATLAGDWAGALDVQGIELRLVLHVIPADGKVTATLDSLDQQAMGIPVSSVTRDGDTMNFEVDAVGGSYTGKLSADALTVSGTWSQGGNELPLELKRPAPAGKSS